MLHPTGWIVAGDQSRVPLKKVSVKANITGYLVGIQSTLQYSNDSEEPLEVLFKFPVEESFAVVGLEAVVGGRKIKAQIREKEEAKQAYDDAKARGFTAALAEERLVISLAFHWEIFHRSQKLKFTSNLLENCQLTLKVQFDLLFSLS